MSISLLLLIIVTIDTMVEKKKLLYCITKSNWGGAQRYVYELATHFAKAEKEKYDVAVALGLPAEASAKAGGEGVLKEKLEEAGVRVIAIPGLKRDVGADEARVFSRLYKIFKTERPDIVHLNSSKIGGLGALAARFAKVPRIIYTVHGWTFREEWRSRFQIFLIKFFSWLTILFSYKVIAVSDYDALQARELPFVREKIVTIKNSIDAPKFLSRVEARKTLSEILSSLPLPYSFADILHGKRIS
ncbi:MAG: glycosyltransferase, partial [Nitrososphaera sp.]